MDLMNKEIFSVSVTDEQTKEMIKEAWNKHKLLLEPHGSVGWKGLTHFLENNKEFDSPEQLCVSLETAHPAKFPEQIIGILSFDPELPESLKGIEEKEESYEKIENNYKSFKKFLKVNY